MRRSTVLSSPPLLDVLVSKRPELVASVRRRVRSLADAEDIVQTAFMRFLARRELLRSDDMAMPWMRGILANATTDHLRRAAAFRRALEGLAAEPRAADATSDSSPAERTDLAMALLDELRPDYRQALSAVYLDASPLPKLAEQAGITVNNAAVRVCRAKQAARRLVTARRRSLATAAPT